MPPLNFYFLDVKDYTVNWYLTPYGAMEQILKQSVAYSAQCSHAVPFKVAGCSKAKWPLIPVVCGQPSDRSDAVWTL